MSLPEVERVIYSINPLVKVICQYRFPSILRIDSEIPSSFQEKIRSLFPNYKETKNENQKLIFNNSNVIECMPDNINHEFISEDSIYKVKLTRTSISLTTLKYERWEHFKEYFNYIIKAFEDEYTPSFYQRIGLRYIDVFDKKKLKGEQYEWRDLIKPEYIGILSDNDFKDDILNFSSNYNLKLDDNISRVKIENSFVFSMLDDNNFNKCFMVDSDFYHSKKIEIKDANLISEYLHSNSTKLIRKIITDTLHNLMQPIKI